MKRLVQRMASWLIRFHVVVCLAWGAPGPARAEATGAPGDVQQVKRSRVFRVFGADDRQVVADTTVMPWSAVGMIEAQWGASANYEGRSGSGVLISDKVVLTCGHVVYDKSIGWADSIHFTPGKNGASEPFGAILAIKATSREEWVNNEDDNYDIALVQLSSPVGQQAGRMSAVGKPPSFFVDRSLNMSGYPADLVWDQLYNASGASQRVEGNQIVHTLDGGPGESGGPIWYCDDSTGQYTVVGVYTGDIEITNGSGHVLDAYGIGVQINATMCAWISDQLAQQDPGASINCDGAADGVVLPACGSGVTGCAGGAIGMMPVILLGLGMMRWSRRRTRW